MEIKTFIGQSLPDALQKAKAELGDEIILLESKEVTNHIRQPGRPPLIQVHVAIDEVEPFQEAVKGDSRIKTWNPPTLNTKNTAVRSGKQAVVQSPTKMPSPGKSITNTYKRPRENFDGVLNGVLAKNSSGNNQEKQILNELNTLKRELNQLSRRTRFAASNDFPEPYAAIYSELEEKGLGEDLAYRFVRRAYLLLEGSHKVTHRQVVEKIKLEMKRLFTPYNFLSDLKRFRKQRVILLLGLTGVGKTVSAMKLAAHRELFGKRDTAIINTESYGPPEALRTFANMSGIEVVEARNLNDIKPALRSLKKKEVVIVDPPGRSPFSPDHLDTLEKYQQILKPTDVFLVLSMSSDLRDLFLSCGLYLLLKPSGFVFTKFDETTQPGKSFSILEEIKLPVVSLSDGERVFIDVTAGNIEYLYGKVFDNDES